MAPLSNYLDVAILLINGIIVLGSSPGVPWVILVQDGSTHHKSHGIGN